MNKIIIKTSLVSFLLMNLFSPLYAQSTNEEQEVLKNSVKSVEESMERDRKKDEENAKYIERSREAQKRESLSIFNSTNLKVNFTCIGYDEDFTDELEPYNPQKENYEDINGRSYIAYGIKDRVRYSMEDKPEYIEFKPTPNSKPVRIEIKHGSYKCYVFYFSEGKLQFDDIENLKVE